MATFSQDSFRSCFQAWIIQQHQDLNELLLALATNPHDYNELRMLAEKNIRHFQEYTENRASLAQQDAPALFSPAWCTTFENSFLWLGGCRPSLSFRLVYSLCGSEIDAGLDRFLGGETAGKVTDLSAHQLNMISSLQCRTITEEDKLSTLMATMQENIADEPLSVIAKNSDQIGEPSQEVSQAFVAHTQALASVLIEADQLRLNTLRELISIFTPLQAADFLAATKKLHLSIHEWAIMRETALCRTK